MKLIPEEFLSIKDKLKSKLKETENGCLEWTGYRMPSGYGCVDVPKKWKIKRKSFLAHRVFFYLENGIQPKELCVMHSCDNRPCCNPDHLSLGTALDNNRDAILKGRRYKQPRFELSTKITKNMFDSAKHEYETTNLYIAEIARKYGVNPPALFDCFRRNGVQTVTKSKNLQRKDVEEILELRANGKSIVDIAKEYSVHKSTIYKICKGLTWTDVKPIKHG